jgi:hypothetical protein
VWTGTAFPRNGEELAGVIQAIDVESRLGQQMRVSSLSARDIEYARSDRQAEQI